MKSPILAGFLTSFLALLGSAGCGGGGKTQYMYEFSETSCATGKKVFSSLAEMCTELQSDGFNSSCALAARQTFFADNCTGTFQETP